MLFIRPFISSSLRQTHLSIKLPSNFQQTASAAFSISARTMAQEYKLKGLSSLDLKDGQLQEVEVEGIEEGKILLAKHNNEVHALGSKCTHFGAPLSKGVLTGEGRLTCPWHGACFNVSNGDIEEAPGLDSLIKFELVQKDGGVYVKGDENTIKNARRQPNMKCSPKGQEKVVVVGGGSGSLGAIEGLRMGGFKGAITCISNEKYLPIDRTKLSKGLMTEASQVQWRSADFYKDGGVEMITDDTVTDVDFKSKKVTTQAGKEHSYTKLVLASGGTPRMLPLEGLKGDLKNVFPLRSLHDTSGIMNAAGEDGSKKVVVVGSSFIGMEIGNALAGKKHSVSVIGMEVEPMERVMGKEVGAIFRKMLEKNGVKFHMGASVEKGIESKSKSGSIGGVSLKDGTTLDADLVVEGVGIRPSTDYLQKNDAVELEKDGSITVDEAFAVKGLQDVWAIGDIATYPYHGPDGNGKPVRIEHWNVAQNAGRSVAMSINASGKAPKQFIPVFWSALGAQLRYCGHTPNGFDDVIIQGNTDVSEGKQSFVAYFAKGDVIVAVASMMKDPYMTQCKELMQVGKMPSKKEIENGADVMKMSVPAMARM